MSARAAAGLKLLMKKFEVRKIVQIQKEGRVFPAKRFMEALHERGFSDLARPDQNGDFTVVHLRFEIWIDRTVFVQRRPLQPYF
jgi:hypothetical protein